MTPIDSTDHGWHSPNFRPALERYVAFLGRADEATIDEACRLHDEELKRFETYHNVVRDSIEREAQARLKAIRDALRRMILQTFVTNLVAWALIGQWITHKLTDSWQLSMLGALASMITLALVFRGSWKNWRST